MADTKFSALDPVSALDGTEVVAVSKDVSGTSTSQRTTTQAIADLASAASGGAPPVVTDATTALTATDANSGNYTRFTNASAKAYTFDSAQIYTVGAEYHGRNVGAGDLTLTEAGTFTLNAPSGGTLVIPSGGTFTVKIVAAAEADVFGVTVAA